MVGPWAINLKPPGEATFTIDDKSIGLADELQGEYVMRFVDPMPELLTAQREYGAPHSCTGRQFAPGQYCAQREYGIAHGQAGHVNGASGDQRPQSRIERHSAQREYGVPHSCTGRYCAPGQYCAQTVLVCLIGDDRQNLRLMLKKWGSLGKE